MQKHLQQSQFNDSVKSLSGIIASQGRSEKLNHFPGLLKEKVKLTDLYYTFTILSSSRTKNFFIVNSFADL